MRGRYIAFEGIEGAGKTTAAEQLAGRLRAAGRDVLHVREPGGTAAGERIRSILLEPEGSLDPWTEALLFAAARAQLAAEVIGPAVRSGRWVVGDRSVYSSLAYQGAGRGLGIDAVRALNEAGLVDVWPDLIILLRVDPDTGLGRERIQDRIGKEGAGFQADVARAFEDLVAAEPDRFEVIDASRPREEVVALAEKIVQERW